MDFVCLFFFKQKTAYEMRISDWSSDVCSSDLSGFGLLAGDVAFLTSILVAIDITLAGLWWAMDEGSNVLARLIRKVLYVGAFALILNNWQIFADVVFQSFSSLGLEAKIGRAHV